MMHIGETKVSLPFPGTSGDDTILTLHNVSRRFDRTQALDSVSLSVRRGEVFALLGPNGAGKTTIAHLLQGALSPDSGEITFYSGEGQRSKLDTSKMGYFPGDSSIFKTMPVNRILYYAGTRRGLSQEKAQQVASHWLARLGLAHRASISLDNLSRGNQQKVQLAEAVLHDPEVVFLDEPFANLDPVNQELFVAVIRELQDKGTTVFLSDHQLSLVERLANRICILNQGRIVAQGTLDDLRCHARAGLRVRIRLADPRVAVDPRPLCAHPAVRQVERTATGEIWLMTREDVQPIEILNFAKTQFRISEIIAEQASLHDVYIHLLKPAAEAEAEQEMMAPGWLAGKLD